MPKTFEDIVAEAIDLRLLEVDKLRLHITTLPNNDVKGYLASLLIARLYAFLEGGVKDIVNAYIQAHAIAIQNVNELKPEYVSWRYGTDIRSHVAKLPRSALVRIDSAVAELLSGHTEPCSIDTRHEYSTMNADALKEIYAGCLLDATLIDQHTAAINQLCGRRQAVAHGRFLMAASVQLLVQQADSSRTLVTEVLYDLAYQCLDGHSNHALKL